MIIVLGLSGLPVAHAGQASWQRPHSVHVNPSSRSFQAEVLDRLDPEPGGLRLEVHGRQLAARRELPERGVEERRRDVQVLGSRQVDQEQPTPAATLSQKNERVAGRQQRGLEPPSERAIQLAANAQAASGSP